jgi:hypothetical protein
MQYFPGFVLCGGGEFEPSSLTVQNVTVNVRRKIGVSDWLLMIGVSFLN